MVYWDGPGIATAAELMFHVRSVTKPDGYPDLQSRITSDQRGPSLPPRLCAVVELVTLSIFTRNWVTSIVLLMLSQPTVYIFSEQGNSALAVLRQFRIAKRSTDKTCITNDTTPVSGCRI